MTLNILKSYEDQYYVGLTGIEILGNLQLSCRALENSPNKGGAQRGGGGEIYVLQGLALLSFVLALLHFTMKCDIMHHITAHNLSLALHLHLLSFALSYPSPSPILRPLLSFALSNPSPYLLYRLGSSPLGYYSL